MEDPSLEPVRLAPDRIEVNFSLFFLLPCLASLNSRDGLRLVTMPGKKSKAHFSFSIEHITAKRLFLSPFEDYNPFVDSCSDTSLLALRGSADANDNTPAPATFDHLPFLEMSFSFPHFQEWYRSFLLERTLLRIVILKLFALETEGIQCGCAPLPSTEPLQPLTVLS